MNGTDNINANGLFQEEKSLSISHLIFTHTNIKPPPRLSSPKRRVLLKCKSLKGVTLGSLLPATDVVNCFRRHVGEFSFKVSSVTCPRCLCARVEWRGEPLIVKGIPVNSSKERMLGQLFDTLAASKSLRNIKKRELVSEVNTRVKKCLQPANFHADSHTHSTLHRNLT